MFERFTDQARSVVTRSQDEARSLGHRQVSPDHLLLALIRSDGVAGRALREAGADYAALRDRIAEATPGSDEARRMGRLPFTRDAKKVLELALREALKLGHRDIRAAHVLLGLLQGDRLTPTVLDALGAPAADLLTRVRELLSDAPAAAAHSPATRSVLDKAAQAAGPSPVTTGQLASAILQDPRCQAAQALHALGVTSDAFTAALTAVGLTSTTDAPPRSQAVSIHVDGSTRIIHDPEIAAALMGLDEGQLHLLLAQALRPGQRPSGFQ